MNKIFVRGYRQLLSVNMQGDVCAVNTSLVFEQRLHL